MKTALILALALAVTGCHKAPVVPAFHVTSVDVCADIPTLGTFAGKEYAIYPAERPLGVACPSPIRPDDVGKDLRASLDVQAGVLTIETPYAGPARYAIKSVSSRCGK